MNKVFAGIAARGKTTKGWFYDPKRHLIINRTGNIAKASFSPGNKYDRKQLELVINNLFGKVFGDRSYISQTLLQ